MTLLQHRLAVIITITTSLLSSEDRNLCSILLALSLAWENWTYIFNGKHPAIHSYGGEHVDDIHPDEGQQEPGHQAE